jgi:uncharacterized membrane protein YphA (DoxX/SURF4 family)
MKYLVLTCRVLVGSLFIVSGLIKANDPLGFSYKLEEYFAEGALNLIFLEPFALILAITACIAEIVLGFAVIFGGKMKLTSWLLLILILFFGWLTLYTATCDPRGTYTIVENGIEIQRSVKCVTDCGCFGDAMKGSIGRSLTPWESFYKDLILFILLIPILLRSGKIKLNTTKDDLVIFPLSLIMVSVFSWIFTWYFPILFFIVGYAGYFLLKSVLSADKVEWPVALYIAVISLGFTYYCYSHLPIRDYSAYKVGNNISELRKLPPDARQPVIDTRLFYKNSTTGEMKEMSQAEYMESKIWEDANWEWADTKTKIIDPGDEPQIMNFNIMGSDGGYDYTEDYLNDPDYIFMLIAYDLNKTNKKAHLEFNRFAEEVFKNGNSVIAISASGSTLVDEFRHEVQAMYDYYSMDEITLKTIVRSNPGLILIRQGTILAKWHHNDIPPFEEVKAKYLK